MGSGSQNEYAWCFITSSVGKGEERKHQNRPSVLLIKRSFSLLFNPLKDFSQCVMLSGEQP